MAQPTASARKHIKLAERAFEKKNGNEVLAHCQEALKLQPQNPKALLMMAKVYYSVSLHDKAAAALQQVIQLEPQNTEAYILFSRVLASQNRAQEAVQTAHRATQIAPQNADAHVALVFLLLHFQQSHVVPDYLEKVMPTLKENVELLQNYAIALKINERNAEAERVYEDIRKRFRIPPSFQIMFETYLPRLLSGEEEIERKRTAYEAALDRFIREKPRVDVTMLSMHSLFQLAYHHRDNKVLMQKYAQMLRACIPELNYVAPHCKDGAVKKKETGIRIGFASRFMHDHPVGRCFRNWLRHLHAHADFTVTLFVIENVIDDSIRQLEAEGVEIVSVPRNLQAAQKRIAEYKLDILVYPDIGMDAYTHQLALARLAPYQCCLLGHPDTTGIDTMDYYISSRRYEVEDAQENYTEQLLLLDTLSTVFSRPKPIEKWYSRAELGLPEGKHLYTCPMAIQKLHPDMDGIFRQILERDDKAVIVLFADYQLKSATQRLKERILKICPADRVLFLDWQPMEKLWSILKTSDAVLSTIYFGAGTTSQYAFGYGIPMVTMVDRFVRSRFVGAYYETMGIHDAPIAHSIEEYTDMALRLAQDKTYYQKLSEELLAKNGALYEEAGHSKHIVQLMKDIMAQKLEAYRP